MATKGPGSKTVNVGSTAAGAGGGTLMVLVANSLPEHSPWKPWVMYAAPTVAVTLRAFSRWSVIQIIATGKQFLLERRITKARTTVEKGLHTEETSLEHKSSLRKNLEEIEKIEVDNAMDRIRTLVQNPEFPSKGSTEKP
jgi:hypothetical protein